MGFSFITRGSTRNMDNFLSRMQSLDLRTILEPYGKMGVQALAAATPVDSGLAAQSWGYQVEGNANEVKIVWTNHDVESGFPVVVMLQYGYSTGTGGYVQGRDFINPAIKPVFDQIADGVWRVVTSA